MDNKKGDISIVPAICTQCGAHIKVNPSKETAICEYCGTPFIVKKAIDEYNIFIQEHIDTVNVQVGKKGVFQSAFDFLDKQQERQHEELRRQQEERERKKENRSIVLTTIGKVLLWIYFFPIMLSIFLIKDQEGKKSKFRYVLVIGLWIFMFVLFILLGQAAKKEEKEMTGEALQTEFTSESTLDMIGKIKYKYPVYWKRQESEKASPVVYAPADDKVVRIMCMLWTSEYTSENTNIETAIKYLNTYNDIYNLTFEEYAYSNEEKVGIAKGEMYIDSKEFELTAYIRPEFGNKNVFIELVVLYKGYEDKNIQDEQALIGSVKF